MLRLGARREGPAAAPMLGPGPTLGLPLKSVKNSQTAGTEQGRETQVDSALPTDTCSKRIVGATPNK